MGSKTKLLVAISLITFTLSLFYIYNLVHFINGNAISSPWFVEGIQFSNNNFIGFTSITLGFLGGLLGTLSIIYLIFEYKWYWIMTITGQLLTIIDSIITGIFLTAISYSSLIILLVIINNYKFDIKEWMLYLIWSLFIIIGLSMYQIIYSDINIINVIDCFCAGLSIYGWFHIVNRNSRGYVLFIINDILYITIFLMIGLPVVASSFVIYGIINAYCLYELGKQKMNYSFQNEKDKRL